MPVSSDKLSKMFSNLKSTTQLDLCHDRGWWRKPKAMQKKFKKAYGFELTPALYRPVVVKWTRKNKGFGEILFYRDGDTVHCANECLSREFVKSVLCDLVDKAVFDDEPRKKRSRKNP